MIPQEPKKIGEPGADLHMGTIMTAVHSGLAAADLSPREDRIELSGEDRAKFLHNLCTADIVKLSPGVGTEAFFLNAKGKTIDFGRIYATPTSLWIDLEAGRGAGLLKHLDRYLFREKVSLHDRTAEVGQIHLVGPAADVWMRNGWPSVEYQSSLSVTEMNDEGESIQVRRVARSVVTGWDVLMPERRLATWMDRMQQAGAVWLDEGSLESLRIEAGIPRFGREITEENLAQEIGRDSQAISFAKGCYIGQETVARLDALGHVNKLLRGIALPADAPVEAGAEVRSGEKVIGKVGSIADGLTRRQALAVLRLQGGMPGDRVMVVGRLGLVEGSVVDLPFPSA